MSDWPMHSKNARERHIPQVQKTRKLGVLANQQPDRPARLNKEEYMYQYRRQEFRSRVEA